MSRADKKQRHKAKREAKRHLARRQASISPVKRLADAKGEIQCWRSEDFDGLGQVQFWVYKQTAALSGLACFLVDRGVVGLKDAFVRLPLGRMDLDDMLKNAADGGLPMVRCTVDEARRMVAGGLRWAHQNGMRQPKDWMKAASFIGGVGDWSTADVSPFELEFAGHPDDLRRRLIGQPFDEYIRRTDIDFMFADNAPVMDLESGEYLPANEPDDDDEELDDALLDEMEALSGEFSPAAIELSGQSMRWLTDRNQIPSTELPKAWRAVMMSLVFARLHLPDGSDYEVSRHMLRLLGEISSWVEPDCEEEFQLALAQVDEHLKSNPKLMVDAMQNIPMAFEESDD